MTNPDLTPLWLAFGQLLARQEALEYLLAEELAERFAGLSEAEVARECDRLGSKLTTWPPIWQGPMPVEELEERRELLQFATRQLLNRAADRAIGLAGERRSR